MDDGGELGGRAVNCSGADAEDEVDDLHALLLLGVGERVVGEALREDDGRGCLAEGTRVIEELADDLGDRAGDAAEGTAESTEEDRARGGALDEADGHGLAVPRSGFR